MLEKIPERNLNQHVEELCSLFQEGQIERVLLEVEPLLGEFSKSIALYNIKGISCAHLKRFDEAIKSYKKAVLIDPENPITYFNLGVALQDSGQLAEALNQYKIALSKNPKYLDAILNIGTIFQEKGSFSDAISYFKKALQIDPEHPIAYFKLALALQSIGHLNQALQNYKIAFSKNPECFETLFNMGFIYQEKGLYASAINSFKKTLALNPNHAPAYINLGMSQNKMGEITAAEDTFRKAITLDFAKSPAKANLGYLLCDQGHFDKGINEIQTAVALDKDYSKIHDNFLFCLNYSPDLSAEEIYTCYKNFNNLHSKSTTPKWLHVQTSKKKRKLKIGYVSGELSRTSVSRFIEPIFINHDQKQFEIYAFAKVPNHDYITSSIKSHCDGWVNIDEMSAKDLASKIRDLGIDILVDLAGHVQGNKLGVFRYKPAPVSLSWWVGFGYTTGLSAIDYFLADKTLVPKGSEHLFAEKVWKLDHPCSTVFRPDPNTGSVNPLPALTNGFITFGTLTRSIRLNDRVIKTWASILKKVPNSRLIINSINFRYDEMKEIFIEKFKKAGISRDRLDIGYESPPWDILRKIDIGLDCFPHNSGTTLVEHLYMGNPYITLADRPSVGRIGSHYLNAIGHGEWIAHSEEEYVEKACGLSANLEKLSKIRQQLRPEMNASPLRQEKDFVKHLEQTYQQMWNCFLARKS